MDSEQKQGWHLDKRVPLGFILAILIQAAMGVWAIADIKKDVEILKVQAVSQLARDSAQDVERKYYLDLMREQYKSLDAKLDRLIERAPK